MLSTAKDETARKIDQINFEYVLPDGPAVVKKTNGSPKAVTANKEAKSKYDEYVEGLRDYQTAQISKLGSYIFSPYLNGTVFIQYPNDLSLSHAHTHTDLPNAEKVYGMIIEQSPNFLAAHNALIQKLELADAKNSLPLTFRATIDGTSDLDESLATLKRIVRLADIVISGTNVDTLLAYYGLKADNRPDAAKIKTDMDKQKANLLEAYVRKAIALGKINAIESYRHELDSAKKVTSVSDDVNTIFNDACKLIDCNDQKVQTIIITF